MTVQRFSGEMDEGGFGAVGDELDGVDEVLSAAAQLCDALFGWEVFDCDVFGVGFELDFEVIELALFGFTGAQGGSFFSS